MHHAHNDSFDKVAQLLHFQGCQRFLSFGGTMKIRISTAAFLVGLAFVTSLLFQNCSNGMRTEKVATESLLSVVSSSEKLKFSSFHYSHGGWFGPPDTPNWSDDMSFAVKTDALVVDSKTGDELCFKPIYTLEDKDRSELLNHIKALKLVVAKDLVSAPDSGSRTITFHMNDGSQKVVFLQKDGASNGDTLATNGSELGDFLQNLNKRIPVACKNEDKSQDLLSFTYYSGGGFRMPNTPSWSFDMNLRVTSGAVIVKSQVHDSLCFKPDYPLSQTEAAEVLSAVQKLDVKTKTETIRVSDAPTKKVTLVLASGETKVVHLNSHSAALGELYAVNGEDFAQLLETLDKKVPMACQ